MSSLDNEMNTPMRIAMWVAGAIVLLFLAVVVHGIYRTVHPS